MCFFAIGLFSHAEGAKDLIECLLWRDLSTGDVGEVVEGETEIFGKEVAAELVVEAVDDAEEAFMSQGEGFVVTGVGDDDVIGIGGQTGMLRFFKDSPFQVVYALPCLCTDHG